MVTNSVRICRQLQKISRLPNTNNFLANIEIMGYEMRSVILRFMALQFLCVENMSQSNRIPLTFSCDSGIWGECCNWILLSMNGGSNTYCMSQD